MGTGWALQRGSAVGDAGDGVGTLDVIDLESREIRTLLTGAPGEYFYVPRWAPSGDAVVVEVDAFVTPRLDESVTDGATVAVFDLRDEVPVLSDLLPRERRASYPDWSPNGDTNRFEMPAD